MLSVRRCVAQEADHLVIVGLAEVVVERPDRPEPCDPVRARVFVHDTDERRGHTSYGERGGTG